MLQRERDAAFVWDVIEGRLSRRTEDKPTPKKVVWVAVALQRHPLCLGTEGRVANRSSHSHGIPRPQDKAWGDGNLHRKVPNSPMYRKSSNFSDQGDTGPTITATQRTVAPLQPTNRYSCRHRSLPCTEVYRWAHTHTKERWSLLPRHTAKGNL